MLDSIIAITLAGCYLVIGIGLLRGFRAWLNWRDARDLSEFNARCMVANAQTWAELFPGTGRA